MFVDITLNPELQETSQKKTRYTHTQMFVDVADHVLDFANQYRLDC